MGPGGGMENSVVHVNALSVPSAGLPGSSAKLQAPRVALLARGLTWHKWRLPLKVPTAPRKGACAGSRQASVRAFRDKRAAFWGVHVAKSASHAPQRGMHGPQRPSTWLTECGARHFQWQCRPFLGRRWRFLCGGWRWECRGRCWATGERLRQGARRSISQPDSPRPRDWSPHQV